MVHDKRDAHWNLGDTQVVIYGHSHVYSEEIKDNRLWLNPGSCGYSRFGREVTMAVMKIENGQYTLELKNITLGRYRTKGPIYLISSTKEEDILEKLEE